MAGATIRCQIRGDGAQHWAVTDDSLTSRAVPSGHGQLRLGPASVEKIVPSALRLPPARVRHECRATQVDAVLAEPTAPDFRLGHDRSQAARRADAGVAADHLSSHPRGFRVEMRRRY